MIKILEEYLLTIILVQIAFLLGVWVQYYTQTITHEFYLVDPKLATPLDPLENNEDNYI
jgi:hypothetical protein